MKREEADRGKPQRAAAVSSGVEHLMPTQIALLQAAFAAHMTPLDVFDPTLLRRAG